MDPKFDRALLLLVQENNDKLRQHRNGPMWQRERKAELEASELMLGLDLTVLASDSYKSQHKVVSKK